VHIPYSVDHAAYHNLEILINLKPTVHSLF